MPESSFRLPIRFPPPPRQNLQTYLMCLGEVNLIAPRLLFKVVTAALQVSKEAGIEALRIMTEAPIEALAPLFTANGDPRRRWASVPGCVVNRLHVHSPFRVCPACLADGIPPDVSWCLTLYTGCATHGCSLASECPDCRRPLLFDRPSLGECVCGRKLSSVAVEPVTSEVRDLLRLMHDACEPRVPALEHFTDPSDLPLRDLLEFTLLLGNDDGLRWGGSSSRTDAEAPARIVSRAASVLAGWPSRFDRFLEAMLVADSGLEPPGHGARLIQSLSVTPPDELGPWHLMVLDRCLEAIGGRPYRMLEARLLNHAPSASSKFVPIWEAARIFGLSATAFPHAAARYDIATRSVRRGPRIDKTYEIEGTRRAAEARLAEERVRSEFQSRRRASDELGVGPETIEALALSGCLRTRSVGDQVLYSMEDSRRLLRRFAELASAGTAAPADRSMHVFCTKWPWLDTIDLIQAVLSKEIGLSKPADVPERKSKWKAIGGLNGYRLDHAATEVMASASRTHLTQAQVCAETGIPYALLPDVVALGFLTQDHEVRTGTRSYPGYTQRSVSQFRERYIHTRELYRLLGKSTPMLRVMRQLNVPAIARITSRFSLYDREVVLEALKRTPVETDGTGTER